MIVAGGVVLAAYLMPQTARALGYFLLINLSLACFNLLPALPLDGGRMLRAILSNFLRPRAATLVTGWLGVGIGAAMLAFCAYLFTRGAVNLFLLVMGVFLVLGAGAGAQSIAPGAACGHAAPAGCLRARGGGTAQASGGARGHVYRRGLAAALLFAV